MLLKTLRLLVVLPLFGLMLGGCSEGVEEPVAATVDDTAVHTAEVAAAGADELMAQGEAVYLANCGACHQPDGSGLVGAFPPLAGSDFLQGNRKEVLAAALFGLEGPITVNGVEYNGVMPSLGHLPDEDLAAAITYVFGSWGNDLAAVSVEEVAALRDLQEMMTVVPEDCRGKILLRRGPPADTICTEAKNGYELVVVSTQGRTGLAHVLLGSVAEQVVRHAPIPVLVVLLRRFVSSPVCAA